MTEFSTIERRTVIDAPASAILPHIDDFTKWVAWSPWEGSDDDLKRTYGGTQGSVGATYAWDGNRKAGAGTMEVTARSSTGVDIALAFTRPWKSQSTALFRLDEQGGATTVTWTMRSPKNFQSRVMGIFMNMDKLVGGDFEKGLAKLKGVVEA
ncbi:SRPBCC family protein [Frondihabitans australicus]|uniref:Polyketide cyclase/dehydrase/lipid transport protein n=1 Tax=Frondihabitans australicus TaxID=386892 RepID=A0A495IH48_9MICO|nr:SRPBCC family protein [Frondihabitans australicus]RKR74396.1 polyketide cyclase/dehydrase/lipid transport protein [Frondihabitans australicus]